MFLHSTDLQLHHRQAFGLITASSECEYVDFCYGEHRFHTTQYELQLSAFCHLVLIKRLVAIFWEEFSAAMQITDAKVRLTEDISF